MAEKSGRFLIEKYFWFSFGWVRDGECCSLARRDQRDVEWVFCCFVIFDVLDFFAGILKS